MAILKSSLEEPLLSREQTAVIRAIAHAAQLFEAEQVVSKMLDSNTDQKALSQAAVILNPIKEYLKAERTRVMTQVKIPARTVAKPDTGNTNVPK